MPIRIIPLPIKLEKYDNEKADVDFDITRNTIKQDSSRGSSEESKESVHHNDEKELSFEINNEVKLAIDNLSQVSYANYIKPWLETWKKGKNI